MRSLRQKFGALRSCFNERTLRLWAAAEARSLGRGGIKAVAKVTGLSRRTIERGHSQIEAAKGMRARHAEVRTRAPGAGRKRLVDSDPQLVRDLELLVDPATRGDPMCPLCWTCKSTTRLADELNARGHRLSQRSVCALLKDLGYSLQALRKTREGGRHPDRNAQFEHIAARVKEYQSQGEPVISVDAKKKELVGNYANKGREWQPKGQPEEVNVYDFIDKERGKVTPYGVLDLGANQGWVSVGIDHDTAEFAVESIRHWWLEMGHGRYARAERLLITADGGGSNGSRVRLWKIALQRLANETGLEISVCHFPPGTSKWNKIEHRMFCHISRNWRGRPLSSRQVVVQLIGETTTKTGLKIKADLDLKTYPLKQKISKAQMAELNLQKDAFHGEWNYSLTPQIRQ